MVIDNTLTSLIGLSIGDSFGETFFGPEDEIVDRLENRKLKDGIWQFTDDTVMGIGVYNILKKYKQIDQQALACEFAENYTIDNYRGYGGTAHHILRSISEGKNWKEISESVFDGMGSMGNGAAMRSAPIGVYFHENIDNVVQQSALSAVVTHSHNEAITGAISVALAACYCTRHKDNKNALVAKQFFEFILNYTPESDVKSKIKTASTLPLDFDIRTITSILGNGIKLTAQDTVPFALWCAAHNLTSYEEAIWLAVSGLGDRDTIAAIVGSIVSICSGIESIPEQWILQSEKINESIFYLK